MGSSFPLFNHVKSGHTYSVSSSAVIFIAAVEAVLDGVAEIEEKNNGAKDEESEAAADVCKQGSGVAIFIKLVASENKMIKKI